MDVDKLYTVELKRVLTLISKDLMDDYPMKKITSEHFILSILNSKQCFAYKILSRIISKGDIDNVYDYYAKYLHENIPPITQPKNSDKQPSYDIVLSKHLTNADEEKDLLSDPKISTEHVLLSMLKTNNNIKNHMETIGVTYDRFVGEINNIRNDEISKNNDDRELAESVSGYKPSKASKRSIIDTYCVNLNKLARQGKIDNLIGRENEVNRIIKIIGRRNKNNVILIGDSGTGKSAIILGIADKIEKKEAKFLNNKTIFLLNTTSLIAGTTYRGDLENRMNNIINELKENKDYILFIDDIHTMLSRNSSNASEIAGILSNALSNGDIQLMSTTSFKEYKNSIENNTTLARRFQKILIEPTSISETENILKHIKLYYENYHNVIYTDNAIRTCVFLADKYITDRKLPDSAIDILDECGSEQKIYDDNTNKLIELKDDLKHNEMLRDKSMKINDFKLGDEYNKQVKEIKSKIIDFEKKLKLLNKSNAKEITETDIYSTVSEITGIPLNKLSISEKEKYLNIEKILNEHVIGQENAIKEISKNLRRNRMGLDRKNKPRGVFLFSGSSGTGKTLLANKIAEEIFGSEKSLIRFDMSEYSDKTSVNKLIGAGAGYVMAEQGGVLTETIKNNPYCVLLLDEIEKSDKEVLNLFLQIFDNGSISDNSGTKISFKNVIIIMTSNIGAREASLIGGGVGFQTNINENKKSIVEKATKAFFSPEFINRLDKIIQFNELTDDNLKSIITIELKNLNARLKEINYSIMFNNECVDYLFNLISTDKQPGARKISRIIQTEIEDRICDLYLENEYENGYIFKILLDNNKNLKII